jgi:N-acetylglucosaminyldiphosphoundecaprenol N-acetyl-beta-D-mannosaminyltransferase
MKKVNILGVNFSFLKKIAVRERLEFFLQSGKGNLVVTPNAEFVLAAQHDEEFFHILNKAELSVLDGSGPQFACWATGRFIERYPGADLVVDLLKIAQTKATKVLIINWRQGLSTNLEIQQKLSSLFPTIALLVSDAERDGQDLDLVEINNFQPSIVIATLGAPYQEKLLFHLREQVKSARILIGVGGALDFLTGQARRAPYHFRYVGLEWLWRLFSKPSKPGDRVVLKRYNRIWNATGVFVYKFIRWQYILPFFYRPNVACWLYKEKDGEYFVMLVERVDQPGHWQLPQGGTDGEATLVAGRRELFEELGVREIGKTQVYENVWRYRFSKIRKTEAIRHSGYKGQRQSLLIAEYIGDETDFKINFWDHAAWRWVKVQDVVKISHERRRPAAQKFLDLFYQFLKNEN